MGIFDFLKGKPIKERLCKYYHENGQLEKEINVIHSHATVTD